MFSRGSRFATPDMRRAICSTLEPSGHACRMLISAPNPIDLPGLTCPDCVHRPAFDAIVNPHATLESALLALGNLARGTFNNDLVVMFAAYSSSGGAEAAEVHQLTHGSSSTHAFLRTVPPPHAPHACIPIDHRER